MLQIWAKLRRLMESFIQSFVKLALLILKFIKIFFWNLKSLLQTSNILIKIVLFFNHILELNFKTFLFKFKVYLCRFILLLFLV